MTFEDIIWAGYLLLLVALVIHYIYDWLRGWPTVFVKCCWYDIKLWWRARQIKKVADHLKQYNRKLQLQIAEIEGANDRLRSQITEIREFQRSIAK